MADMILNSNYGSLSKRTNYLTSEMQVSSLIASDRSVIDNESHIMAREVIIKKLFEALLYSSRKEIGVLGLSGWFLLQCIVAIIRGYMSFVQKSRPVVQNTIPFCG